MHNACLQNGVEDGKGGRGALMKLSRDTSNGIREQKMKKHLCVIQLTKSKDNKFDRQLLVC